MINDNFEKYDLTDKVGNTVTKKNIKKMFRNILVVIIIMVILFFI